MAKYVTSLDIENYNLLHSMNHRFPKDYRETVSDFLVNPKFKIDFRIDLVLSETFSDDIAIFPKGLSESQVSAIAALLDSFWITKILNVRECEDGTVRFQIS